MQAGGVSLRADTYRVPERVAPRGCERIAWARTGLNVGRYPLLLRGQCLIGEGELERLRVLGALGIAELKHGALRLEILFGPERTIRVRPGARNHQRQ